MRSTKRRQRCATPARKPVESLEQQPSWKALDEVQREALLTEHHLAAEPEPNLADPSAVLAAAQARPLQGWTAELDAIPQRASRALEAALRLTTPAAKTAAVRVSTASLEQPGRDRAVHRRSAHATPRRANRQRQRCGEGLTVTTATNTVLNSDQRRFLDTQTQRAREAAQRAAEDALRALAVSEPSRPGYLSDEQNRLRLELRDKARQARR